jgi:SHS2 domain-containing protein
MDGKQVSGFEEIPHTADWALHVWAPDAAGLFEQAASGMYALMQTRLQPSPRVSRQLDLESDDLESLLVGFLNELLYFRERDNLAFDRVQVKIDKTRLTAVLEGAPLAFFAKEIKAATYHLLSIRPGPQGFETTLVFDV